MYDVNYQVREEQLKDLRREAANERLARQVEARKPTRSLRNSLGNSLVQVGQKLMTER